MSELIRLVNSHLFMPEVAAYLGFEVNSRGFIRSPFHDEKTASCKCYNKAGAGFCDFSSGIAGDCLKFVSLTQNLNTWESAKMMIEAFSLPINIESTHLTKNKVQELKRQREADQRRKVVNQKRWVIEIDALKATINTCEDLLMCPHIEPLSDIWCAAVEQRNKTIVKANELIGIETTKEDLRLPKRSEDCSGPYERQVS